MTQAAFNRTDAPAPARTQFTHSQEGGAGAGFTFTIAGAAGLTTYVEVFEIYARGAVPAADVVVTLTDVAAATVIWREVIGAFANQGARAGLVFPAPDINDQSGPLRVTAEGDLLVTVPAPSAGVIVGVNLKGYIV